ncbi:hypothetical protein ACFW5S_12470 [Streptomyces olivaceus]|uniref:hypothetical protein n=1 Tax=Streptomyces olivaceus TaxID=47716 RepID=UPI0036C8F632
MTWSAALPGAALRVMRTAAGRRALRVVLLMGGLFVLGMLCATRAQAADGAPSLGDAVGRVATAPAGAGRSAEEAPAVRGGGSGAVPPDLRPVTAGAVRSATDRIARPVRGTVETAVGEVRATARDVLSTLPSAAPVPPPASPLPSLPLPPSPSLPSLSVPPVSVLPDLSGIGGPPGASDQQGATGRSERPAPDRPDSGPAAGEADRQGGSPDASGVDVPGAAATAAPARYGPASGAGGELLPDVHTSGTGAGRAGPTAAAEAEAPGTHGDPDGSLGTASGADHGVPRHGDVHAVTPYHRIPLRLVAAVLVRADEDGTRDPYRDIPVSPA